MANEALNAFPIGCLISTVVYGIGNRSEVVSGEVVEYRRNSLIVATPYHGSLFVEPAKATRVDLVCQHSECVVGLPCKRQAPDYWQAARS